MYQLDYLVKEHIEDLRREVEQERLAASLPSASEPGRTAASRIVGNTLVWAGKRLSYWGQQLQNGSPALR